MSEEMRAYEETVRERLRELLKTRSQSDLARKTGEAVSSISRYLKGRRIPVDFCCALVKKLELNPSWLLLGEGETRVSDVSASTAKTADNMLELVEAMNSITRKSLGSLLKDDHYVSLRRLDDALNACEQAKNGLKKRLEPVFRKLLDDYSAALRAAPSNMELATTLRAALHQVTRFADDPESIDRFQRLEREFFLYSGNAERALTLEQNRFVRRLLAPGASEDAILSEGYEMMVGFYYGARLKEGVRLGKMILAFVEDAMERLAPTSALLVSAVHIAMAMMETDCGDLESAVERTMRHAAPLSGTQHRYSATAALLRVGFLSGTQPFSSLVGLDLEASLEQGMLMKVALWLENREVIGSAMKRFTVETTEEPSLSILLYRMKSIDNLLKGSTADIPGDYLRFVQTLPEYRRSVASGVDMAFIHAMGYTQLLRLAGKRDAARKSALESAKLLETISRTMTTDIFWRAIHHRNVLELAKGAKSEALKALRPESEEFFRSHIRRGYRCFKKAYPELDS